MAPNMPCTWHAALTLDRATSSAPASLVELVSGWVAATVRIERAKGTNHVGHTALPHPRRQRGGRRRRLPPERGHRDLPDHAGLGDGRARGLPGRPTAEPNLWGARSRGRRDAVRGRRGGRGPRGPAGGRADDDVHRLPGAPADAPGPLQDRRRADVLLHARRGAHAWPRTRSRSSATTPTSWPRAARGMALLVLGLRAGGAGPRRHRPRRRRCGRACPSSTSSTASAPRTRSPRSCRSTTTGCARSSTTTRSARIARARSIPDRPVVRGTSQNPDAYFQSREAVEPFYARFPAALEQTMARFAELTGRRYRLFDYVGPPGGRARRRPDGLGRRVRARDGRAPRAATASASACSRFGSSARSPSSICWPRCRPPRALVSVLDRTKEPGSSGEPLLQELTSALVEAVADGRRAALPRLLGGRYGLASKELTPAMVKAVFDNMRADGAEAPLHGRHPRRRLRLVAGDRPGLRHRARRRVARGVLRPRRRRHRLGQQGEHQDHRRGDAALRAGALRVRLAQGRLDDHLAPALRAAADSLDLPHPARAVHRRPRPGVPRTTRRAVGRDAGRDGAAQHLARARARLGVAAARGAGAARRAALPALRHRRLRRRRAGRARTPHQHGDADLLLRALEGAPASTRRCGTSAARSRRPGGAAAPRSSSRNVAALDAALAALHEVRRSRATVSSERRRAGRGAGARAGLRAARDPAAARGARRRAAR